MFDGQCGIGWLPRAAVRAAEFDRAPAALPYCPPGSTEARRLIATSVRRAGFRVSRIAPDALERLVDYGRQCPDAIDNVCRASLYLARIDRSRRLTLAHVDKVVRLRVGQSQPVWRPAVRLPDGSSPIIAAPQSMLFATVSMLMRAGMVIGLGAWLASGPDPGAPAPGRMRVISAVPKPQPDKTVPAAISAPLASSGAAGEPTFAMVALAPDRAVEAASASSGEPPSPDAQVTAARSSPLSAPAEPPATMVAAAADASGVALPATAPPRVVIRYPEGDTAAWSAAQELRASLQASGIQIVAVAAAGRRVTRETVRYYYDQDRPVAEDIADRLGPPFTGPAQMAAVGPTDQPRAPGTIEVAVPPGRATSAR